MRNNNYNPFIGKSFPENNVVEVQNADFNEISTQPDMAELSGLQTYLGYYRPTSIFVFKERECCGCYERKAYLLNFCDCNVLSE